MAWAEAIPRRPGGDLRRGCLTGDLQAAAVGALPRPVMCNRRRSDRVRRDRLGGVWNAYGLRWP
jgi:hypothetical protein